MKHKRHNIVCTHSPSRRPTQEGSAATWSLTRDKSPLFAASRMSGLPLMRAGAGGEELAWAGAGAGAGGKLISGNMSRTLRVTASRCSAATCCAMYLPIEKHELMVAALRIACAACALAHACTRWQAALFITALHVCGCGCGGNTLPGLGLRRQERTWAWQSSASRHTCRHQAQRWAPQPCPGT